MSLLQAEVIKSLDGVSDEVLSKILDILNDTKKELNQMKSSRKLKEMCKIDLKTAHQDAIKNGTADMSLDNINKIIYGK